MTIKFKTRNSEYEILTDSKIMQGGKIDGVIHLDSIPAVTKGDKVFAIYKGEDGEDRYIRTSTVQEIVSVM